MAQIFDNQLHSEENESGVGDTDKLGAAEAGSCPGQGEGSGTHGKGAEKGEVVGAGLGVQRDQPYGHLNEKCGGGAGSEGGYEKLQRLHLP